MMLLLKLFVGLFFLFLFFPYSVLLSTPWYIQNLLIYFFMNFRKDILPIWFLLTFLPSCFIPSFKILMRFFWLLYLFFLLTLKNSSLTYHFFHLTLLKSTAMKTYIKYISCWQLMSSCLVDRVKRPVLLSRDSDTQEYCLLSPLL